MQLAKLPRGLRVVLERSQLLSVPRAASGTIVCERGVIWLTVGGNADVILYAGERASLEGPGQVVIEALAPSQAWFDS